MSKTIGRKIEALMYKQAVTIPELCKKIEDRSSDAAKKICKITEKRLEYIIIGGEPTIMETILIAQAMDTTMAWLCNKLN